MKSKSKISPTMKKKKKEKRRNTVQKKALFPLILAALCSRSRIRRTLIKKCLRNVSMSLPHVELSPILALLPSLLKSNCAEIVCKSAEIVGAASLASFEMNEKIALEDEIVKRLISLFGSSKREIAIASCNAVLDLSTTFVGQQRLLEFNAIEKLILCLMQEYKSSTVYLDTALLEKNEYLILLLQGVTALINSCSIEQLQRIPFELSDKLSILLKRIWREEHKKRLYDTSSSSCDPGDEFCISSNIKAHNLVESIFRLSVNHSLHPKSIDPEHVEDNIFYLGIKPFLSNIWETSPMLIRNTLGQNSIFSPFIHFLGLKETTIPTNFLPTFLKRIISCPDIASDELNILQVIKHLKNSLGYPIIYDQDIRVVQTKSGEKEELHYFQEQSKSSCSLNPRTLTVDDISKCEIAFKEGYSIALRGIEFRDQTIAAIADRLASIFGQPSAGVNMYMTPSNSQGLARHSDDHCVFVCQIIGAKRWMVYRRPDFQLPRLYESCDSLRKLEEDKSGKFDECQEFVLKEGDVLYIPRGTPHEAVTDVDGCENANNAARFSLHLTLAVEIEPPFEWEGFLHVAVYCWATKQNNALQFNSVACTPHLASLMLLHIVIKSTGAHDFRFRKACLVGAMPFFSETRDWLCENQKTTCEYLISTVISESKFSDAFEHLKAALEINEDHLEHVRWIKCLDEEEDIERRESACILWPDEREVFDVLNRDRDIAEAAFVQVKSRFCREVEFEDVKRRFQVLLEKYRKVRKQYTNGMLALHSALRDEHEFSS